MSPCAIRSKKDLDELAPGTYTVVKTIVGHYATGRCTGRFIKVNDDLYMVVAHAENTAYGMSSLVYHENNDRLEEHNAESVVGFFPEYEVFHDLIGKDEIMKWMR